MRARPGMEVSVTGGGSGAGITALLNRTTDICPASRDIRAKKGGLAEKKGVTPVEFEVASALRIAILGLDLINSLMMPPTLQGRSLEETSERRVAAASSQGEQ